MGIVYRYLITICLTVQYFHMPFKIKSCQQLRITIQFINYTTVDLQPSRINGIRSLVPPPPFSLVPHLIGPLFIGPPTHCTPQHFIVTHWYPISLVPSLTGPPSHWSPFSLVTPSSANPNGPHLIGPPSHWFPRLTGPPSHWPPISLVPFSLVPKFISPPLHCLNALVILITGNHFHWSTHFGLNPSVPHPTGPPSQSSPSVNPYICAHWSPISLAPDVTLVTQFALVSISLVPQCNPGYTTFIGPPSHWSPNVTLVTQFSMVPHPIGAPVLPWLHNSHWSPISLAPAPM